jgi:16S rRNA (guanine966-N2)-methyltransferase
MRIISGYLKGKKIDLPKDNLTRPLKDMVKESIFNIIEHSNDISSKLKESVVLDLFSGTGSFGLECVSRGAKKVIFNENYNSAINILEKNIKNLNCENKCQILKSDCFNLLKNFNEKVDIIFMDPPFKEEKINELIISITEANILKQNALIIIHRNKKNDESLSERLKIVDTRYYGLSKIIFAVH